MKITLTKMRIVRKTRIIWNVLRVVPPFSFVNNKPLTADIVLKALKTLNVRTTEKFDTTGWKDKYLGKKKNK